MHLTLPAGPWSVTSECCLWTFRVWLAQGVSGVLCPGVWVRDSVQLLLQLPPLSFVSPISFEIVAGSAACGFQSHSVSRYGFHWCVFHVQSLGSSWVDVLYTWNIQKCWHCYQCLSACVAVGGGRRQTDAVFENTFLHISLLLLGSGCAAPLGTRPEHSPNSALCNHQLENATSIKHGLTQSASSVRAGAGVC